MMRMGLVRSAVLGVSVALLATTAQPALSGPGDDTLNVVWEREQTTLDVYYFTDHTGLTLIKNVWDGLVERDPQTGEYIGNLATSWEWENDTSLVMDLRRDVTFHNGEPFDADDVVYTLNYVTDPANKVLLLQMVNWIKGAEKIDQYKVRILLKQPFPPVLEYLSLGVPIYPNEYYAEVGTEGMGKEPVGTGPYKVVAFEPGREYVLERFDDYFEGGAKPRAQIKTVKVSTVKDTNLQIGKLMTGQVDFLWRLQADQADQLRQSTEFQIVSVPTIRTAFMLFTVDGADGPFSDVRVRRAFGHAINREAIAKNLLRGESTVVDTLCSPIQVACPDAGTVYDYDPEKARRLLAEAGYEDGFDMELATPSFRYVSEAIVGDLKQVGINASLKSLVWATFRDQWVSGELPAFVFNTGFWGIGDAAIAFGTYHGGMPQDMANDPEVNALLEQASVMYDLEQRTAVYGKAQNIVLDNAYWLPLAGFSVNFALSPQLSFQPTSDEVNRFYLASWK